MRHRCEGRSSACEGTRQVSVAEGAGRGCRIVATVPMVQTTARAIREARGRAPTTDVPPSCTTPMRFWTAQKSQKNAPIAQPTEDPRSVRRCSRSRPSSCFVSSIMLTPTVSSVLSHRTSNSGMVQGVACQAGRLMLGAITASAGLFLRGLRSLDVFFAWTLRVHVKLPASP